MLHVLQGVYLIWLELNPPNYDIYVMDFTIENGQL